MKRTLATVLFALGALPLCAQAATPPTTPAYQAFSSDQLDQLLGPIALYPDPLLSEILPAATFPTEVAMAERFVSGGVDPNVVPGPSWDASVQALTHYPSVLKWMNDNPIWTAELGEVFVNQQQDVIASIQRLRTHAANVGNLKSTPQEEVVNDSNDIQIVPTDDDNLYVPDYQDNAIYYEAGYPLVFGGPFPMGSWLHRDFDWYHHHLVCWDNNHPRPHHWWREPAVRRDADLASNATVWHSEKAEPAIVEAGVYRGSGTHGPVVNRALPGINFPPAAPVRVEQPTPASERTEFVEEIRSAGTHYGGWSSREPREYSVTEFGHPTEPEHPAEPEHFTKFAHLIEPPRVSEPEHFAEPAQFAEPARFTEPEHWSQPERRSEPENRRQPEYRPEPVSRSASSFTGGSSEHSGADRGGDDGEKGR